MKGKHCYYAVRTGRINKNRVSILMHRYILNPNKGIQCDHINGDGLDNRRSNLRIATNIQNSGNKRKQIGSSKFKGVFWNSKLNKWEVQIKKNYKSQYLGLFSNEFEAAKRYDEEAIKYFGEYAKLNFDKETI